MIGFSHDTYIQAFDILTNNSAQNVLSPHENTLINSLH